jgi:hypothetical protein
MPKYNTTHLITRNFAYGDPVIQYKKGTKVYLNDETATFAEGLCADRFAPVKKVKKVEKDS